MFRLSRFWIVVFKWSALFLGLAIILHSCSSVGKSISNQDKHIELYIYHNGFDTIIKNSEAFLELEPSIREIEAVSGIEINQNWLPDKGSSFYMYIQVVGWDSVYERASFYFDPLIVKRHQRGLRICKKGYKLFTVEAGRQYMYFDNFVNSEIVIRKALTFSTDTLVFHRTFEDGLTKQDTVFIFERISSFHNKDVGKDSRF